MSASVALRQGHSSTPISHGGRQDGHGNAVPLPQCAEWPSGLALRAALATKMAAQSRRYNGQTQDRPAKIEHAQSAEGMALVPTAVRRACLVPRSSWWSGRLDGGVLEDVIDGVLGDHAVARMVGDGIVEQLGGVRV